jgi:hypothetical protein
LATVLPTLDDDPTNFLGRVAALPAFATEGVALGRTRRRGIPLHWAVVDPARHRLVVWQKPGESFLDGARRLDASVVTNGPFANYASGRLPRATARFALDTLRHRSVERAAIANYTSPYPLGHVVSATSNIREVAIDRSRVFHFGRRGGDGFDAYAIGRGNPPSDLTEAVGGLFGCVVDGTPYNVRQHIRVGYWGLAPAAGDHPGLTVFLGGWGSTQTLAGLFAALGVRDGVQIDGGDSLLFGAGRVVRVGNRMPPWKRFLQRWGICFRPVER